VANFHYCFSFYEQTIHCKITCCYFQVSSFVFLAVIIDLLFTGFSLFNINRKNIKNMHILNNITWTKSFRLVNHISRQKMFLLSILLIVSIKIKIVWRTGGVTFSTMMLCFNELKRHYSSIYHHWFRTNYVVWFRLIFFKYFNPWYKKRIWKKNFITGAF